MRQRYFLAVSGAYIVLGLIIMGRSIMAHVFVLGILGVVFVALGAVRIRDFMTRGGAR
jgi:hypothetical protein